MPLCPILSNPSGGEGRGTASQNSPPPLPSFGVSQLNFGAANGRAELRGVRAGAASWGLRFFGGGGNNQFEGDLVFWGAQGGCRAPGCSPSESWCKEGGKKLRIGEKRHFWGSFDSGEDPALRW